MNTESEQGEANDKDKKGAGEQGNETNSNSNDASNTGDSETNPGINDLDSAISEIGSNFSNVPDLIKMEVDVDWSKEDTTKNVKKTIKTANSDIWGGTTGTGGGVGGGVGGGGSFINHAESLMDSAVKFTAEAFYGQGSNEHNLGIGGGVGGGDVNSIDSVDMSEGYVNIYLNDYGLYDIEYDENKSELDLFIDGKLFMHGIPNGQFIHVSSNLPVKNMSWNIKKINKTKASSANLLNYFSENVYAANVEGTETLAVISSEKTKANTGDILTYRYGEQICKKSFGEWIGGAASHLFFGSDSFACTFQADDGTYYGVEEMRIGSSFVDPETGEEVFPDQYYFYKLKLREDGRYEKAESTYSFIMTDDIREISEEDKQYCIDLKGTTGGVKNICYSSSLNENPENNPFISEEEKKKNKKEAEENKGVIKKLQDNGVVNTNTSSTPILQFVNQALAQIVEYLYKPYPDVQKVGDEVFGKVLSVSISLIPLAIILTIAISMRNGASSASGIAETRTFFIELIVSLGLAVSSHYIIQQTTKIGTVIAGKIVGNKSFQISGDLMSSSNVLEGILMLIVGILFVFMLVAIIIEVFLSAMAMQAHYVMLCAFSPLMLIMSSYKPFKSLRDQWFKMVLHGMIIAPANAIILSIMNTIA